MATPTGDLDTTVALTTLTAAIATIQVASHQHTVTTAITRPHPLAALSSAVVVSAPAGFIAGAPLRASLAAAAAMSAPPGTVISVVAATCLDPLVILPFLAAVMSAPAGSAAGTTGPFDAVAAIGTSAGNATGIADPLAATGAVRPLAVVVIEAPP
jgi:hypothetical protein